MTINESARAQWKAMKDKSPAERKAYFMQYYAVPVAVAIAVLIFVGLFIGNAIFHEDPGLYNIFMNAQESDTCQPYLDDFGTANGINIKKNPIYGDFSIYISDKTTIEEYESLEKLVAMVAGGTVDTITAPNDLFYATAYNDYFMDLRLVLDESILEQYADRLIYVDMAVVEQVFESIDSSLPVFPDPFAPETMGKPVPVGILLEENCAFTDNVRIIGETPAIGISCTTKQLDTAKAFLYHVLEIPQG